MKSMEDYWKKHRDNLEKLQKAYASAVVVEINKQLTEMGPEDVEFKFDFGDDPVFFVEDDIMARQVKE